MAKWAITTLCHGITNTMEEDHFIPISAMRTPHFVNPVFVKHLTGGLEYVMARNWIIQNHVRKRTVYKKVLSTKLDEPTELVVLDDQRVLFTERKGKLKLFNPKTGKTKVVGEVPVYTKQEYGLMG
jgi:cytochrome c